MDIKNISRLFAVLFVVLIVTLMSQVTQKDVVSYVVSCEDYIYKVSLNVVPTHLDIYTIETGTQEFFKSDDATEVPYSTILHCGHKYRIIYSSEGYQDYTEEFSVSKYVNVNPFTKQIKLDLSPKPIELELIHG